MPVFIDAEFTSFKGELISLALVADDGSELYVVRRFNPMFCHNWVLENVVPILGQEPEDDETIKRKVAAFLNRHKGHKIYFDWPEDGVHLLELLVEPHGVMRDVGDLELHLIRDINTMSTLPHHALHDARALMDAWYGVGNLPDGDFGAPI
jgi:hypothetical protein